MFQDVKENGRGTGQALGHCTYASSILSGLKIENEVIQQNIQNRLNEAEKLREKLTELNHSVYHETALSISKLPELETKNFAMVRSMEDQLYKDFDESYTDKPKVAEEV